LSRPVERESAFAEALADRFLTIFLNQNQISCFYFYPGIKPFVDLEKSILGRASVQKSLAVLENVDIFARV